MTTLAEILRERLGQLSDDADTLLVSVDELKDWLTECKRMKAVLAIYRLLMELWDKAEVVTELDLLFAGEESNDPQPMGS
jgi:hypothetical protein